MPALLIADASPSDIRVRATALELRNRKALLDSVEDNRRLAADRKKRSAEVLDRACDVGAEYIHAASNTTRTVHLEDYVRHYHPNE